MKILQCLLLCLCLFLFTGAKKKQSDKGRLLPLTSVHIVDRNGFTESISSKDRLSQFQGLNFLTQQPYKKVLRIWARDSKGNIRSVITTYHDNGTPKQFLEVVNGRANGHYYEWHDNGKMSVAAHIIGGEADITPAAEKSWLFDGISGAWDDQERAIAEVQYSQGSLEGTTTYFHPNGQVWKRFPYVKGQLEGVVEVYLNNGELLQQTSYCQGIVDGSCKRFWAENEIASEEIYCRGRLMSGLYLDKGGAVVAEVVNGSGWRAIFSKNGILELQEFRNGVLEGEVRRFHPNGSLKSIYHVQGGIKHGEETEFFASKEENPQPKLSFSWYEGKVQGMARTWYPSGVLESQKEMSNNTKNGLLSAYYSDGNLMMLEHYDEGKLMRGDYFQKGERHPISQVIDGKGCATLYGPDGHFVQKVAYLSGKPEI